MRTVTLWRMKTNQAGDSEYRGRISEARVEGERHHCQETILLYVQTAPGDIQWQIDRHEFDEIIATIPSMLLVFAWAQFMIARTYSLDSLADRYC